MRKRKIAGLIVLVITGIFIVVMIQSLASVTAFVYNPAGLILGAIILLAFFYSIFLLLRKPKS